MYWCMSANDSTFPATIIFRIMDRSMGKTIRSVYPGASSGFTGLLKTAAFLFAEIFFHVANRLAVLS